MDAVNRTDKLTVGDVANRLGLDIGGVIKLVYDGELYGRPDPKTGRLLFTEAALEAFEDRTRTDA